MTSEIRPFRKINRKLTKEISVGKVKVGGNNPITVQTMTNTLTSDHKSTIEQINKVSEAGADIVRVSCPDVKSTDSLKIITKHIDVPIVADIHFHYRRALKLLRTSRLLKNKSRKYRRCEENIRSYFCSKK